MPPPTPKFLFAYGTLQPRFAPQAIRAKLKALRPAGRARVMGELFDLGPFPAAVFDEKSPRTIGGVLFRLPSNPFLRCRLLDAMDDYEGTSDNFFVRVTVRATLKNGRRVYCWAYQYNGPTPECGPVFDGCYVGPRKHRRTSQRRRTHPPKEA